MSEAAVYTRLNAISDLQGRVYPLVLPQNVAYPAATYQRISATRYPQFGEDADAVEATIQVDVYKPRAEGYGTFNTLVQSVRGALQRARGSDVIDIFIDAERDDYEDDTELLRKTFDVRVWYRET